MLRKLLPLVGALAIAGQAHAVAVNMSDFSFAAPATVEMTGTDGSPSYDGPAGRFDGTLSDDFVAAVASLTTDALSPTSFVAWCAELTQTFAFGVTSTSTRWCPGLDHFGAKTNDDS